MYKPIFNQRKALRFRQFTRKGYALFACLGRVVTIGVLSVATLESASAATDDISTKTEKTRVHSGTDPAVYSAVYSTELRCVLGPQFVVFLRLLCIQNFLEEVYSVF